MYAMFKAILPTMGSNENNARIDVASDSDDSPGQYARERDSNSKDASDAFICEW